MRIEELDVDVPDELIAQRPLGRRDSSRLLVVDRRSGDLFHRRFSDIPGLLEPGDVLVLNDSRVLPARLRVRRETGGLVELLFLHARTRPPASSPSAGAPEVRLRDRGTESIADYWEVLARPSHRLREGEVVRVSREGDAARGCGLRLEEHLGEGRWAVRAAEDRGILEVLASYGEAPLPPYIREPLSDAGRYQTIYAEHPGSAAAPTAGLHFTRELLERLDEVGVEVVFVTLHVGLDTFQPVREERVEDHPIHNEEYRVGESAVRRLDRARAEGRRIVAVGTTTVRVLETLYRDAGPEGPGTGPLEGQTDLFVTPGFEFRAVDALVTNFHLPRTSLIALVMAFAGKETISRAYRVAAAERYRFFSFGDAMLIDGRARLRPPAPSGETSGGQEVR